MSIQMEFLKSLQNCIESVRYVLIPCMACCYPSSPESDITELETLFADLVPKADSGGKSGGRRRSKASKHHQIHLIDPERVKNTEAMLINVKMPLPVMLAAALAMDESILDADQVENLIRFCPTREEIELLKGYTGDKENLGKCEQFFMEMMKVPRVETKLRVFLFKIQFKSQISDIRKSLSIVNSACEEVRNSLKLEEILMKILYMGNTLNQKTVTGSAAIFKLDTLLKVANVSASNIRMTLMQYFCKVVAGRSPHLLNFHEGLTNLEAASKIQLNSLAEEMQDIMNGLEEAKLELGASEHDGPVSEVFLKTLKEFIRRAETEMATLKTMYSIVGKNADGLALHFGEDPCQRPFEQVTATLHKFVSSFQKAHLENCLEMKAAKVIEMEKAKGWQAGGSDLG